MRLPWRLETACRCHNCNGQRSKSSLKACEIRWCLPQSSGNGFPDMGPFCNPSLWPFSSHFLMLLLITSCLMGDHRRRNKNQQPRLPPISNLPGLGGCWNRRIERVIAELVRIPGATERVQREVRKVAGGKLMATEDDVARMTYLKAVTKEFQVLRLHTPAPILLPRETMEDIQVQGYVAPRKAIVLVNVWGIAGDPASWEAPEEFRRRDSWTAKWISEETISSLSPWVRGGGFARESILPSLESTWRAPTSSIASTGHGRGPRDYDSEEV
ncbi:hypothetical protein Taro_029086 [Colocasia esculenta]|uniref:Uncharacterized protein n=1 Tax=Colocasia esculenta TaxID=4460 RepID=A0A843VS93_COLES|nr:hypothetical protein [Colocasia esculenta]